MTELKVPVSVGELIDKITILEIKSQRIADPDKLANVRKELAHLSRTWEESPLADACLLYTSDAAEDSSGEVREGGGGW